MFGFPNWIVLAVVAAVSAATAGGATYKITSSIYKGEIASINLAHERAVFAAIVKAQADQRGADAVTLDLTVKEGEGQIKIVEKFRTIEKEIPIYVQDTSACLTYGLIRVLDAAALGADPKDLILPTGEYNDTCAPVKATDLANNVVANYKSATQNAEQLGTLQAWAADVKQRSSAP